MKVLFETLSPYLTGEVDKDGRLLRKNVMVVQPVNEPGMQVAACCGSAFFDLAVIGDKTSMYYDYPRVALTIPQLLRERVKGVGLWFNNDGRVPETGEDDQSVFDTFTFNNGEKVTFQFRKCEA